MSIKQVPNTINTFFKKPFPLLDAPRDKWFLIVFCGLFATFFLIFYQPLNLGNWNHDSAIGNFLTIWSAGILGALVIGVSQFFLRPKFKLNNFNLGQFIIWVLFEFFLLSILFYFLYSESNIPPWQEYLFTFQRTVSLTIIPYFFACLLIAVQQLSKKVKEDTPINPLPIEQYLFNDENGKIALAIKPQQLLYLKSENNYTSIYFLQNEKVEKKLIRTTLKNLEKELGDAPNIIRIHRSYMVNLQSISSVQRIKGNFQVELTNLPNSPLKVSESYKAKFATQIAKS